MPRMVKCMKLGKELPGLDEPPFDTPLGQKIFENVSAEAGGTWLSLVEHSLGVRGVGSSNLPVPTILLKRSFASKSSDSGPFWFQFAGCRTRSTHSASKASNK